jgi:hypothetical protein
MLFNLPNNPIKQLTTNLNPSMDTTMDTTMDNDTLVDKYPYDYVYSLFDAVSKFAAKHTCFTCLYLSLSKCRNIYWDDLNGYATDVTDSCNEERIIFFSFDKYLFMKTFDPMDRSDD